MTASGERLLTVNAGSSSLKFALFSAIEPSLEPSLVLRGSIERIGLPDSTLSVQPAGGTAATRAVEARDGSAAATAFVEWLEGEPEARGLLAAGHRIVHGGSRHVATCRLSAAVRAELRTLVALDAEHMPLALALVDALERSRPALPQVACFDTAFHATLPLVAQLLPLPRRFFERGVRRFGFHGLAFTSVLAALEREGGAPRAEGRLVLAHLGSGASLAAVAGRRCLDTTMAFTPCSGLPMGTRSGDLDAGLLAWLCRAEGLDPEQLDRMVRRESGLLGISETSSDVRDLLGRAATDPRAEQALELFCREVKKRIGACVAVLGGLDGLVFSGGIGEHAAPVRARICEGLEVFGLRLDPARNAAGTGVISADGAAATVRVVHADEERVIAGETARLLRAAPLSETAAP